MIGIVDDAQWLDRASAQVLEFVARRLLAAQRGESQRLDWLSVAYNIAAMDLWEDQAWFEHSSAQAQLARATGTLSLLPYALDYLARNHIQAGALSLAAGLITEAEVWIRGSERRRGHTSRFSSQLGGEMSRRPWV